MLVKPPLEKLLPKASNRYVLAMLAAQRARQLVDGARHYAEADSPNLVTLACQEIACGEVIGIKGRYSQRDIVIPLRPDIEARRLLEEEAERIRREQDDFDDIDMQTSMRSAEQALLNLTGQDFADEPVVEDAIQNAELISSLIKLQQERDAQSDLTAPEDIQAESSVIVEQVEVDEATAEVVADTEEKPETTEA